MIQLEFQSMLAMFCGAVARLRRKPELPSAIEYTLRLSSALRVYALTHPLHDVMCAVAKLEAAKGHATIPGVAAELSCTFQNVTLHVLRHKELFIEEAGKPRRYRLSAEAVELLLKIKKRTSK